MSDFIEDAGCGCLVVLGTIVATTIPAWITHVVSCINHEQWIFLVAGAIFFPIGIVHGWGIWLGVW